ncbi:MAG: ASPIC/UnbV domain-containing protein, partial [Vicinamibacterales bacterium]
SAPATDPFPFRQPRQLLRNLGNGRFADVSRDSGPAFARTAVGRGLAVGDLDNDGDLDLIVANDNDRLELLLDESERPADWTGVRLVSREGRDATGARVGLRRGDGTTVWRRARADGSYASSHDPRVIVGLNGGPLTGIEIVWPGGERESFPAPPAGRYSTVTQGSGSAIAGSTR